MMLAGIILGIIGIAFAAVGLLIWRGEKITLLHDYHYDRVAKEDRKAFCAVSGWGILVIGIGILATAVLLAVTESAFSFLVFAAGFAVGLSLLIYVGKRYNVHSIK